MKRTLIAAALTAGLMGLAPVSYAAFVNFNELTSAGTVQKVNSPIVVRGLQVTGGQQKPDNVNNPRPLTIANFGDELGLGVCSTSDLSSGTLCDSANSFDTEYGTGVWDGQIDELENMGKNEFILIKEIAGVDMTGQFRLGSFDGTEAGFVTYGKKRVTFIRGDGIIGDTAGGSTLVQDSGNVWILTLGGFDSSIRSVKFKAGCGNVSNASCGDDNDYLVAGASVVPIPAAAWLFGSAMLGLVGIGRRRSKKAAS